MAGTILGTGTTVVFGTTAFAAELLSLSIDGIERAVIDTSHFGTAGARTKRAGDLYEPPVVTMDVHLDPDYLAADVIYTTAAETVTITFDIPSGKTAGATLSGTAFASRVGGGSLPLEDKGTIQVTVQFSDDVTWGAAA